jgi:hypothetical protein
MRVGMDEVSLLFIGWPWVTLCTILQQRWFRVLEDGILLAQTLVYIERWILGALVIPTLFL